MSNPFHRFLLKQRVYCDLCSSLSPATQVIEIPFNPHWPEKNKTVVVCDGHYRAYTPIESGLRERGRLEAK